MEFKEWIIKEMAHMGLGYDVDTVVGPINAIDFRFEDYPKTTQQQKDLIRVLLSVKRPPFYAKLPQSHFYVIYDGDELLVSVKAPPFMELPSFWWDYAACYLDNEIIKKPLRLRIFD